jgi:hypothetical protein
MGLSLFRESNRSLLVFASDEGLRTAAKPPRRGAGLGTATCRCSVS